MAPAPVLASGLRGLDPTDVAKCRELLRTVPSVTPEDGGTDKGVAAFDAAPADIWRYSEDPGSEAQAAAAALQAAADPEGGALLLSHAWEQPEAWEEYFSAQPYAEAKQLQISTGLRRIAGRLRGRDGGPPKVWADCASMSAPVEQADHPLEKVVYGPFRFSVRDLKALIPPAQGANNYTTLPLAQGMQYEGTMHMREFDQKGRPSKNTEPQEVKWEILPGAYWIRSAHVIAEDRISAEAAAAMEPFRPGTGHIRSWCTTLALRDEVWVEFTLGTLRTECLLLARPMVAMHQGLVACVGWNYFDRLWPLCEWAIFCARCGVDRVQLAADALSGASLVEYHRAVRRISVEDAACRDPRDRELVLDLLEQEFICEPTIVTTGFQKPAPGVLTAGVKERVVDFSGVERFVRVTAIAVLAHEAAISASRRLKADDECGWISLAAALDLQELYAELKYCKPWEWMEIAKTTACERGVSGGDEELTEQQIVTETYEGLVEAWWTGRILPVLAAERTLAVRP